MNRGSIPVEVIHVCLKNHPIKAQHYLYATLLKRLKDFKWFTDININYTDGLYEFSIEIYSEELVPKVKSILLELLI
jgi:hypothetical protein